MSQLPDADDRGGDGANKGSSWRWLHALVHVRAVGPLLAIALIVAGFGIVFAHQAMPVAPLRTGDAATATASLSGSATAPASSTATSSATGVTATSGTQSSSSSSSTSSGSSGASNSTYPTPVAYVESVAVTADPADNFTHTCATVIPETFTLTVSVDPNVPAETVTYSMSGTSMKLMGVSQETTGTLDFAAGETTKTVIVKVDFSAGAGDGSPLEVGAGVAYPDSLEMSSNPGAKTSIAFTCVRQLSMSMTPSISTLNAPCATFTPITMTWAIVGTPGPRLLIKLYGPTQSNPGMSTWFYASEFDEYLPATQYPSDTSSQVSGVFNTGLPSSAANGTYWLQIATTSPTALTAQGTVVTNC